MHISTKNFNNFISAAKSPTQEGFMVYTNHGNPSDQKSHKMQETGQ
jgi:hypothetical protein